MAGAVVGQGRAVFGQLQGGEHALGLADGGLDGLTGVHVAPVLGLHVLVGGHGPDLLVQLDAGGLAQAEALRVLCHEADLQRVAHGVEEVVAGVGDGAGDVHVPVGQVDGGVNPADRGVTDVLILGVDALVVDDGAGEDLPLGQARDGGAGLEGGAGGVGRAEGPVEQRGVLPLVQALVVVQQLGDGVGGPAGDGQRLPGVHVHRHGRAAGDELLDVGGGAAVAGDVGVVLGPAGVFLGDVLVQGPLRGLLHPDVDGQIDVVAGDGLLGIDRVGDHAGGGARHPRLAVGAVEIAFKSQLRPGLAHIGVQVIAQRRVLVHLLAEDLAGVAQQMPGGLGLHLPGEAGAHVEAAHVVLHQRGDQVHAHVLGEDVVGGVEVPAVAAIDLIADARDGAGLLGGVAVVDLIAVAHEGHQLHGGGAGAQVLVVEIGLQKDPLPVAHGRVLKGRGLRDGQGVDVAVPEVRGHRTQPQNRGVGPGVVRVVVPEQVPLVDDQVVDDPVLHQNAPIAVHDVPPGRADPLGGDDVVAALLVIGQPLHDLELVQGDQADGDQRGGDQRHEGQTAAGNEFLHMIEPFFLGEEED